MPMSKLVYLAPAAHDMEEIVKFHIANVGPASARKVYASIEGTINRLAEFPLLGQTHPDPVLAENGFRKLVLTKTYVAVYKIIDDTVYIYHIVNGRTDYPRLLK
ncbi:MAG: type II toxin-antitoxin system RelE/ParE family toxin [Acutalibacter muris]|nr:type II toxin-antitoxin system RelE/ParE family toxin [Acutalibacter muris]